MAKRTSFTLNFEIDLDGVPGWGYKAQDFIDHIKAHLNQSVPHYNPVVTEVKVIDSPLVESRRGTAFLVPHPKEVETLPDTLYPPCGCGQPSAHRLLKPGKDAVFACNPYSRCTTLR